MGKTVCPMLAQFALIFTTFGFQSRLTIVDSVQLTETDSWLAWNLLQSANEDAVSSPMNNVTKTSYEKVLHGLNIENSSEIIHRVDSYSCGTPQHLSSDGEHELHHRGIRSLSWAWAWHTSSCAGIRDDAWKSSNGGALAATICSEVKRLRHMDIHWGTGVAIDIGANIGDSTVPMALLANRTIAFDPSIDVYKVLRATAALNPQLNIDTYNMAVADEDGVRNFSYGYPMECNGGIALESAGQRIVQRKTVNLESFLLQRYGEDIFRSIRYIKTDVEGFDYLILNSIHSLLKRIISIDPTLLPVIQVEYFKQYQMSTDHEKRNLSQGAKNLFSAIVNLPGNYMAYCTGQCNHNQHCKMTDFQRERINITVEIEGKGEIGENGQVRNGPSGGLVAVYATVQSQNADEKEPQPVRCEDMLLIPATKKMKIKQSI